ELLAGGAGDHPRHRAGLAHSWCAVGRRPALGRAADGGEPAAVRLPRQHHAGRPERGHRRYRLVRREQCQRRVRAEHADLAAEAGWNPSASDYTRYLPPQVSRRAVALWAALGVFVSCVVLETVGAASATIGGAALGDPTGAFTGHLPTAVADLTLLAIALGAVS